MLTKENFIFKEEPSRVLPGNIILICRINLEASIITPTRQAGEDSIRRALWERTYGDALKLIGRLRKRFEVDPEAAKLADRLIQMLSYDDEKPVQQTKRT